MVFYSRIIASFHTVRSSRVFLPRKCLVSTTVGECANSAEERKQLFSVAPMMEYTDRHQRYFQRLMSKHTVLYTEMVTSQAITRTDDPDYLLRANIPFEEPLVFQLGGADPVIMGRAAKAIKDYGYSEININCGCPSEKVAGAGAFGASLMLNPKLVADIASSIHGETGLPTTVKCRIGVDGQESYENLTNFINTVSTSGIVKHFIIHARIAVLGKKFSADDNRKIPPLKYDVVYQLVKDFPHLRFTLNGGVQSVEEAEKHIHQHGVHGVMVGRAVVSNPYHWGQVDSRLFGQRDPGLTRRQLLEQYALYCQQEEAFCGKRVRRALVRPLNNLFYGVANTKHYRIELNRLAGDMSIPIAQVIERAVKTVEPQALDS